jgi:hypothetical protein
LCIRNTQKVIDLLDQYPLYTMKNLDYLDWKILINLKSESVHKSNEGLMKMRKIKEGMNSKRVF